MIEGGPALSIRGLDYRYPGAARCALEGLDLELEPASSSSSPAARDPARARSCGRPAGSFPTSTAATSPARSWSAGRSTRDAGPAELAGSVGFVAQEPETQVVSTTVRAELELPMELRGGHRIETARAVEEAALALGIEPLLERTTDSLSGGELQRVALGAALVTGPPLLLLDEPTSQLDPVAGDELISLLRRLNEEWGVTILLGEHRLERCLAAADRVLALEHGRLIYDGPPAEFGRAALDRAPALVTPVMRLFDLAGLPGSPVTVKAARAALGDLQLGERRRGGRRCPSRPPQPIPC